MTTNLNGLGERFDVPTHIITVNELHVWYRKNGVTTYQGTIAKMSVPTPRPFALLPWWLGTAMIPVSAIVLCLWMVANG